MVVSLLRLRARSLMPNIALAMLVLGFMVRSNLMLAADLHTINHAASHSSDHEQQRVQLSEDHFGAPEDSIEDPDKDHEEGPHGLMHQSGGGASSTNDIAFSILATRFEVVSLVSTTVPSVSAQRIDGPFRPPIS